MTSSASFDPNTWYQIANYLQGNTSGLQSGWPAPYPYGSVFGSPFSNDGNEYYWQIVQNPLDNSGWLLRNRASGPGIFMGTLTNYTCTGSCQYSMLDRVQPQINDTTVFYINPISSDNNAFTFSNKLFGSSNLMDLQDNGSWLWFHENADTDSAKWAFNSLGSINDPTWSTISTTASYLMSSTAAPDSTSSPTPTLVKSQSTSNATQSNGPLQAADSDSDNLSTGVQAAIGIVVAAVVVVAVIVFGLWYSRRKRRQQAAASASLQRAEAGNFHTFPSRDIKLERHPVEAPGAEIFRPVEMDAAHMKPAELYGDYDIIGGDGEKGNIPRFYGNR